MPLGLYTLRSGALDQGRQVVRCVREFRTGPYRLQDMVAVRRRMHFPQMPRAGRRDEVWGVGLVRDEDDVIEPSVKHLLKQGVDRIIIADHGSVDRTRDILERLSDESAKIYVVADSNSGYFQREKISILAFHAWKKGARWIVPFDADEFWFAERGNVAAFLRHSSAKIVHAAVHNAVSSADTRPDQWQGELLVHPDASFGKVAFRSHPLALVWTGNHGVTRVGIDTPGLSIVHLPYRSIDQVRRKYRQGARALDAAGLPASQGWHWRTGAAMTDDELSRVWSQMRSGKPVPELDWMLGTPPLAVRPSTWDAWDPDGQLRDTGA